MAQFWLPKFKHVNLTASADIVAAVVGKQIRVLALHVNEAQGTADVVLTIEDAAAGADLGIFAGFALSTTTLPYSRVGWFETTAGNALYGTVAGTTSNLNLSIVYVEI